MRILLISNSTNAGEEYLAFPMPQIKAFLGQRNANRTTNDMPVVQPESFSSFNLVPFQINPHFLDANPEGYSGETREDRIKEFIQVNQNIFVVGLREGTMLMLENGSIRLIGERKARIFRYGINVQELSSQEDFNFLLK